MSKFLWLKDNSIKQNERYVTMILKDYGFEVGIGTNCQISVNGRNNDYDVCLSYMGKSYRIQIDEYNRAFNLLEENKALNIKHKNRHHVIKKFYEKNINNVLDFIINRGKHYLFNQRQKMKTNRDDYRKESTFSYNSVIQKQQYTLNFTV